MYPPPRRKYVFVGFFSRILALKSHKHAVVYAAHGPVVHLARYKKRSRRFSGERPPQQHLCSSNFRENKKMKRKDCRTLNKIFHQCTAVLEEDRETQFVLSFLFFSFFLVRIDDEQKVEKPPTETICLFRRDSWTVRGCVKMIVSEQNVKPKQ